MRNVEAVRDADQPDETAERLTRLFRELRQRQSGAFSRQQAVAHGITDKVLSRRCRARQIQRVHGGVYVDFTGPLPWETRVWAAWLAYAPDAALTGATALRWYGVEEVRGDDRIHLAVPHPRRVDQRAGILVSRHRGFAAQLHGSRTPPIVRIEVAALMRASADPNASRQAALLLDVCRQRATTPQRLLAELDSLTRLPARQVLRRIVLDAADGVQSFLEQVYLRRVERAHALPTAERQVRVESTDGSGRRVRYRDVRYSPYGLVIELDGHAGHSDSESRWRDMHRDNSTAMSGELTLRFGYQLVDEPCLAALQVATALRLRGWAGTARACSASCSVARNAA
ncbi:type IV toxin-antitoxin system AbiEi family antitoxin domain-containing protein [Kribbella sp. VKM Ac-2566]|uniref:type IV toxin-antitoxin system AbiEi family antitoxin domain-containing protein n=1 Tax=Kribbella sp. VKM Ac-2566 TaxID=2512218 RepID=UPI00106404FE|nr:type IV toxin-antitoxin system AbiEi family antitoxin domain-containing protein [Kribbella sp. VKM Ac-2566]TDW88903.1 hypothetical protein EV647_5917 [Kribbella sp. VKM Ac-2566]